MHVKIFLSAYKIIIIILMIITIYTIYIFVNTIFASNFLFICQFLLISIQILHYHVKHVCFVGWHLIFHVCWKCNKLEMPVMPVMHVPEVITQTEFECWNLSFLPWKLHQNVHSWKRWNDFSNHQFPLKNTHL